MKELTEQIIIDIVNSTQKETVLFEHNKHLTFQMLSIESISFIRIIIALEEHFDCEFPDSKLIYSEMDSVEKIFKTLKEVLNDKTKE